MSTSVNVPALKGKIKEVCGSQKDFAKRMNLTEGAISNKLNGKSKWSLDEIIQAAEALGIAKDKNAIINIFFYSNN